MCAKDEISRLVYSYSGIYNGPNDCHFHAQKSQIGSPHLSSNKPGIYDPWSEYINNEKLLIVNMWWLA